MTAASVWLLVAQLLGVAGSLAVILLGLGIMRRI